MDALLQVNNLVVRYGGLYAVNKVSFSVSSGQLLGLIGPNGAGKTSCLKSIAGQHKLSQGSILLAGVAMEGLPTYQRVRAGMGITHQIVRPIKTLTVLDNVAFAWGSRHMPSLFSASWYTKRDTARVAAHSILERLGIAPYAQTLAAQTPLGIRKRLEVARALALEPRVLLLDEPLAGLNTSEAKTMANLIRSLSASGLAIVLIEHNLGEINRICDILVVLEAGQIISQGEPQVVMTDKKVIHAYIGGGYNDVRN